MKKLMRWRWLCVAAGVSLTTLGCNDTGSVDPAVLEDRAPAPPDSSPADPVNPEEPAPARVTDVLLFNGTGVSTSDWQSTEKIVKAEGLSYQRVNSAQLNAMTLERIASFGAIVVPGGSGGTITRNLTTETRLRVRKAVREHGVGYVGFCAGAWVAVGPEAETTRVASYGLAVAGGAVLELFLPGGRQPTADMVDVQFSNGSHRQLVWWGGPATPEWSGGVVARYDDGQPAISQTWAGRGLVVISGPHPEAPQGWRATAGRDSDGLDFDIAVDMIRAALVRAPLRVF